MALKSKLIFFVFFLFGLFPILPFDLKPVMVIFALIFGIYTFINNRNVSFSSLHLINSLVFLAYLISVIYSLDKTYALKKIETTVSLILMPLFFILISNADLKSKKHIIKAENIFQITFYISSILFCLIMFAYVYSLGYYSNVVNYDFCMSYIQHKLWGFNEHPIYISIFLSLALMFSFNLFFNINSKKIKIAILLNNIILLGALIFLSRKGIIIGMLFSVLFLTIKFLKTLRLKLTLVLFIIIGIVSFYFLFPSSLNRISEIFDIETYTEPLVESKSTSIRMAVYKCAFEKVPNAGFIGYGVGDVKDVLYSCYENTSNVLTKWRYNTHNQYLNIILACGFLGFSIFIFVLFRNFKFAYINRDYMFLSVLIFYTIILLTENVLDRQNGVILYSFLISYYIFKNFQKNQHLV